MLSLVASTLAAASAPPISVTYTQTVDMHISEIMTVFLSDDLNPEWSPTLSSHRQVYTRQGELAHQQYKLPWPLLPREVLLSCERKADAKSGVLTSQCHSVENDAVPQRKGVVRLELSSTKWRIESLPDEKTRLTLSLEMPASQTQGVPKYVVRYCQRSSLRDSVTNLIDAVRRLDLPPHESFLRWRRSNAAALAAVHRSPPARSASAASPLLGWAFELASRYSLAAVLAAAAAMLTAHALTFAWLLAVVELVARVCRGAGLSWSRGRISDAKSAAAKPGKAAGAGDVGDSSQERPLSPTSVVLAPCSFAGKPSVAARM